MKKLGAILAKFALTCIALAAVTLTILFVGAWSIGTMVVSGIALLMFYGDGTPSDTLFWSTIAISAIIGAMIGIGMILIDPEKARRWGDR